MINKVCVRCVMDSSDPDISFDSKGVCNHCRRFDIETKNNWFPNEKGIKILEEKFEKIRSKGNKYDCILGLSGGVDSSYLAIVLKRFNLKVLAVHVDAGWNSELAVSNIETIVKHCNFDLYTEVIEWSDMRNLQLAFLESGTANQDIPQDHIFFSVLYRKALEFNCKVFLSGGNIATEFVFPESWNHHAMDSIFLNDIYKKHGKHKLKSYKTINFFDFNIKYRLMGFKQIRPLNFIPYNTTLAIKELEKMGWRYYGYKHGESFFTRFFQNYFLIERFGYDKRKPHLSSRILSGEISRDEAIKLLQKKLYKPQELKNDIKYFCNKMNISNEDFNRYLKMEKVSDKKYKNWDKYFSAFNRVRIFINKLR